MSVCEQNNSVSWDDFDEVLVDRLLWEQYVMCLKCPPVYFSDNSLKTSSDQAILIISVYSILKKLDTEKGCHIYIYKLVDFHSLTKK